MSVVYFHVEVSASGRSLIQRIPTKRGVSECDREITTMKRHWASSGCGAVEKNTFFRTHVNKPKERAIFVVTAKNEAPSNFYSPSIAVSSWSERVYLL